MNRQAMTTAPTAAAEIRLGSAETIHEGHVELLLEGFASVFNEKDSDGQYTTGRAFKGLKDEWACPGGRATWLVRGTSPRGPLTPVTRVRPGELRPHKDVLTACMGVRGSHAIREGRPQGGESAPPAGLGRVPRQRT